MATQKLTRVEANIILEYLRRVTPRGADEERQIIKVITKLEQIAHPAK